MKKLFSLFFACVFLCSCASQLKPKTKLIKPWEDLDLESETISLPYIALYQKKGKTLIYLASKHGDSKSLDLADYAFSAYKPQIALIEYERDNPFFCCLQPPGN